MAWRPPTELTTRTMKDAIGGLSLVRLDISGNNLTNKTLFFSTDKCLHFKPKINKINHTLCSNLTPKFNNSKSENGSSNYSAKNQTFWGAKHFITHPNQFIHVGCFIIYMIKQSTQHNPTCEFSVSYLRVYLKSKGNMVTFFFLLTDR